MSLLNFTKSVPFGPFFLHRPPFDLVDNVPVKASWVNHSWEQERMRRMTQRTMWTLN